ncbi:Abi-alpha family protein [Rodentibacter myodis]|uniref:DUF4393 domain-containing protein n=1 Tax=Rodentibacter myodis TaxID=1907939 RepID=A0A1V3JRX4_9PAST|nr:Abi-alpha family protein [Rodentibacter myodis]OOF59048.1 hypothetical protein BKL49_05790 [Rodentibacter myodis]
MPEPISSIKTATEIVKPDSASEILALQNSSDIRLQNAGNYEADTKEKIAETKNFLATIAHGGLVVPLKKIGGAVVKIAESFSLYSDKTKNSINKKIEHLKSQGILAGEISSIPAFADIAERLVYLDEEPDLKQMFENLLTSTVDLTKNGINHPAYVEVLKQISNQEAHNLKLIFTHSPNSMAICNLGFKHNGGTIPLLKYCLPIPFSEIPAQALENWERLKLIEIIIDLEWVTDDDAYKYIQDILTVLGKENASYTEHVEIRKGVLRFTEFGKNFAKATGIIE